MKIYTRQQCSGRQDNILQKCWMIGMCMIKYKYCNRYELLTTLHGCNLIRHEKLTRHLGHAFKWTKLSKTHQIFHNALSTDEALMTSRSHL